jgi:transglutaminase-like putative cysteine protease
MKIFRRFSHDLSRETRDTLFILAVVAWTVFPHMDNLPTWGMPLTVTILLWRTHLALTERPLPKRWMLLSILLLAVLLSLFSFKTILGKQAGVTFLVTLIALKTLEMRARRDAFVIFFLGFFLVLTHFFYSQTLGVALAMLVSVWGLLTALVLMHMPVGQPALKKASAIAAKTALLGAPIMVALFVLFPRIPPLWGVPQESMGSTGLSDRLHMGGIAELAQSTEIVMRLRFPDGSPSPSTLYFRGPVLSQFDGVIWAPSDSPQVERPPQFRLTGSPIRYEITLEPQRTKEVPLLEFTPELLSSNGDSQMNTSDLRLANDLGWRANQAVFDRLRLELHAFTSFQHGPTEFEPSLYTNLQLPNGHNPRTVAWAKALSRQPELAGGGSTALANAVMQHIRQEEFHYTLTPGTYGDEKPQEAIDEFWLDRRQGFCEHFASAFVFIMRSMGVPSRIVTGYQGADPQPIDGYYIVRKSSAHAWAEYWAEGKGWVRADPTAYVAPERIHLSANLAPPPGVVAGTLRQAFGGADILAPWRHTWEAINNRWNQWILGYSRGHQMDMLKNFGFPSPDWVHLGYLLLGFVGSTALAIWGIALGRSWRKDPWSRQMALLREELRRLGLPVHEHDAPLTLSRKLLDHLGGPAQALAEALVRLDRDRYGNRTSPIGATLSFRQLRAMARNLGAKRA